MNNAYILVKFGTIKGYRLEHNPAALALVREYISLGACASAMHQMDTPEQKQILCELLRVHQGPIINDWSGEEMTVEQASSYVLEYGNQ